MGSVAQQPTLSASQNVISTPKTYDLPILNSVKHHPPSTSPHPKQSNNHASRPAQALRPARPTNPRLRPPLQQSHQTLPPPLIQEPRPDLPSPPHQAPPHQPDPLSLSRHSICIRSAQGRNNRDPHRRPGPRFPPARPPATRRSRRESRKAAGEADTSVLASQRRRAESATRSLSPCLIHPTLPDGSTVHQQGLALHEKILRHFDLSSQYGPCIGVARPKRWKRAHRLGLAPPVEVLAVLVREEEAGRRRSERAYVDELLSTRLVVE